MKQFLSIFKITVPIECLIGRASFQTALFAGTECELHKAMTLLNCSPCCFHDFTDHQDDLEPTSKTEEVKKDLGEVNQDSPPADGPRSAAHEIQGETTTDSAFLQDIPPQQFYQLNLNYELESLRQESNRSAGVGQ